MGLERTLSWMSLITVSPRVSTEHEFRTLHRVQRRRRLDLGLKERNACAAFCYNCHTAALRVTIRLTNSRSPSITGF